MALTTKILRASPITAQRSILVAVLLVVQAHGLQRASAQGELLPESERLLDVMHAGYSVHGARFQDAMSRLTAQQRPTQRAGLIETLELGELLAGGLARAGEEVLGWICIRAYGPDGSLRHCAPLVESSNESAYYIVDPIEPTVANLSNDDDVQSWIDSIFNEHNGLDYQGRSQLMYVRPQGQLWGPALNPLEGAGTGPELASLIHERDRIDRFRIPRDYNDDPVAYMRADRLWVLAGMGVQFAYEQVRILAGEPGLSLGGIISLLLEWLANRIEGGIVRFTEQWLEDPANPPRRPYFNPAHIAYAGSMLIVWATCNAFLWGYSAGWDRDLAYLLFPTLDPAN